MTMNLQAELENLTGKSLTTLSRQMSFDLLAVTPTHLLLFIQSSGKERKLRWKEIESAWQMLQRESQLTRVDIRDNFSQANPAYVAALLAALPGVTHRLAAHPPDTRNIITLYYGQQMPGETEGQWIFATNQGKNKRL